MSGDVLWESIRRLEAEVEWRERAMVYAATEDDRCYHADQLMDALDDLKGAQNLYAARAKYEAETAPERPLRRPWMHGLRRRLYSDRMWWRYLRTLCEVAS